MVLPNFIIAGASKSGTTSLHMYLKEHPQILMSEPKEPYFFCEPVNDKDLERYEKCFNFDGKDESKVKAIGESTSVYMNDLFTSKRIKDLLGSKVKIIFLLRNPRDRVISAYYHMYKRDAEKRLPAQALIFDTIVSDEVINIEKKNLVLAQENKKVNTKMGWLVKDDPNQHFYYVRNSFYSIFIEEFFKHFSRENFLFLFACDLKEKPVETLQKVEMFLGVDDTFVPKDIGVLHNQTFIPSKNPIPKIVGNIAPFVAKFVNVNNKYVRMVYNRFAGSNDYDVDLRTKDYLDKLFLDEKKRLSDLIGIDLSHIWK